MNDKIQIIDDIVNYMVNEFDKDKIKTKILVNDDVLNHREIGLAYTTLGDEEIEIQVNFDIWNNQIKVYLDNELDNTIKVEDINDYLDFDCLISLHNREIY